MNTAIDKKYFVLKRTFKDYNRSRIIVRLNKSKIKKNWEKIQQKFLLNFNFLSKKDLEYVDGEEEKVFCNLQKKIGISREELIYLMYLFVEDTNN